MNFKISTTGKHMVELSRGKVAIIGTLDRFETEFFVKNNKTKQVFLFSDIFKLVKPNSYESSILERDNLNRDEYLLNQITWFYDNLVEHFQSIIQGDFYWEEELTILNREKKKLFKYAMTKLSPYDPIVTLINQKDDNWICELKKYLLHRNIILPDD